MDTFDLDPIIESAEDTIDSILDDSQHEDAEIEFDVVNNDDPEVDDIAGIDGQGSSELISDKDIDNIAAGKEPDLDPIDDDANNGEQDKEVRKLASEIDSNSIISPEETKELKEGMSIEDFVGKVLTESDDDDYDTSDIAGDECPVCHCNPCICHKAHNDIEDIAATIAEALNFPNFTTVGKHLICKNQPNLSQIDLPNLKSVGGGCICSQSGTGAGADGAMDNDDDDDYILDADDDECGLSGFSYSEEDLANANTDSNSTMSNSNGKADGLSISKSDLANSTTEDADDTDSRVVIIHKAPEDIVDDDLYGTADDDDDDYVIDPVDNVPAGPVIPLQGTHMEEGDMTMDFDDLDLFMADESATTEEEYSIPTLEDTKISDAGIEDLTGEMDNLDSVDIFNSFEGSGINTTPKSTGKWLTGVKDNPDEDTKRARYEYTIPDVTSDAKFRSMGDDSITDMKR